MKIRNLTYNAFFIVIMTLLSQIYIPAGPVLFNLGVMGAFLTGLMLTPRNAFFTMLSYLIAGAVGLPVFAGFKGGAGVIFGVTGGYIIGYIFISTITAYSVKITKNKASLPWEAFVVAMMLLSLIICYLFGTVWFMFITGTGFAAAVSVCVLPFIIPDILKLLCALFLKKILKRRLGDIFC